MESTTLEIDCDTCVMQNTAACADCLVTYLCDREPHDAVIVTIDELRSMRLLSEAGLVPSLKHRQAPGSSAAAAGSAERRATMEG